MIPQILVRAAEVRLIEIQDLPLADARFMLFFFVRHLTDAMIAELRGLGEEWSAPSSVFRKYSADGKPSTVDVVTIAAGKKKRDGA